MTGMQNPFPPRPQQRVTTAIRFDPALHEALRETADELGVTMNWIVTKLCREGLDSIDLANFKLVGRPLVGELKDRPATPAEAVRFIR